MERIRNWSPTARTRNFIIMASVAIILVVVIVAVVLSLKKGDKLSPTPNDRDLIECPGLTEENCTKLMCEYKKVDKGPSCFMKKDSFGYQMRKVIKERDKLTIYLKNIADETPYGKSLQNVLFRLTYLTENVLRFQFKDADHERYEVPVQKDFPLLKNPSKVKVSDLKYEVIHSNLSDVFHFQVKRREDGTNLWDTRLGGLMLSDQFLQIGSYLPSENVYGLGENAHDTLKHRMDYKTWTMFTLDRPPFDHGPLYGVHPFYTCLEPSGKSHGVFLLNSNAMEATLLPAPAISFRTIGGILDFFIFVGDDPEHVVQLYTSLIGRPMMPPYWSLGFQLSRYGYNKMSELTGAVERTRLAGIPQAVQFLDIDHMQENMDFTWNRVTFPGLLDFINKTKSEDGLKWIIILDPAIAAIKGYEPYESGVKNGVYVNRSSSWDSSKMFPKELQNESAVYGRVWPPTYVAFPDFFKGSAKRWWKDTIVKYRDTLPFDGLWIDMNEPANFETNVEYPDYCKEEAKKDCWSLKCPNTKLEDPPYNPLKNAGVGRLSTKTLCMESVQIIGGSPYKHYNVHSLYGWSQSQPTLEAAQEATGTRSLVISRSTYPSSGRYAGHWLGDNDSTYKQLKLSIIGMLEFNLFGIPYIGADVCGFWKDTTPDLCKRWMQLGAFYPFYRNHNGLGQINQDPAAVSKEVAEASRKAVERRLSLNPYLYTLFYRAHVDGNTVVRPVFHEFPLDKETVNMGEQFMWGKALLMTPILDEGRKSVKKYLPEDEWWFFDKEKSRQEKITKKYVDETRADEYTPIHVRGGHILPYGKSEDRMKSDGYSTESIILYIFPKEHKASGELFVDDGNSIDSIEKEAYVLYTFKYEKCTLTITSTDANYFNATYPVLNSLVVFKVRDISKASGGGTKYNVTTFQEYESAEISVKDQLQNIEEIKWESSSGDCKMLP